MSIWTFRKAVSESDLGSTTKLVLFVLDQHVNDMGDPAFPSYARLEKLTSLSRRAVIEHVAIAEALGWLRRETRSDRSGRQQSNLFYLRVPTHPEMRSQAGDIPPSPSLGGDLFDDAATNQEGAASAPLGAAGAPPRVQQVHPELSIGKNQRNNPIKKSARAMPADFVVTDAHRAWAASNGLPSPDAHFESFRDYHLARGSTFRDWDAALRTWMRNAVRFSSPMKATWQVADVKRRPLAAMDYAAGVGTDGSLL